MKVRPLAKSVTGWLAPRWPYFSLVVLAPAARADSWWPRQMPKVGTPSAKIPRRFSMASTGSAGSPGPLDSMMPSGFKAATCSAVEKAGITVTLQPRRVRQRTMFRLQP